MFIVAGALVDLLLHVFPIRSAKLELLELAGRSASEFVPDLNRSWAFVVGHLFAAIVNEILL